MSTQPLLPAPAPSPPAPKRSVRVEYLDFQNLEEHREFRLRVYGLDGSTESRFRIPNAAFAAGRVKLQDGPEVCYQKLLRALDAGGTAGPDVITIDDADLASYREAHTPVRKHRSGWTPAPPPTPDPLPRRAPRTPSLQRSGPPPVADDLARALEEGQRVSHATFGVGVTGASGRGHTVVCFDEGGTRTFVTSILKVDVLSAPHVWETSPRGKNRPCRVVAAPAVLPPEAAVLSAAR